MMKKEIDNPNFKHGLAIHGKRSSLYLSWQNMKQRCSNPKHPKYKNYGRRGIKVCEEWNIANGFISWALSNNWREGLTIDRIDYDKGYCPENCRWVSREDNSRRKHTTKITNTQAMEIRKKFSEGNSLANLGKEYGCTEGNIWWIVKG